jgi:hypothetical protein
MLATVIKHRLLPGNRTTLSRPLVTHDHTVLRLIPSIAAASSGLTVSRSTGRSITAGDFGFRAGCFAFSLGIRTSPAAAIR